MRKSMIMTLAGATFTLVAAGAASASDLQIENAAARVVIIPEARGDVQVSVTPGRAGVPPLRVQRTRAGVEMDGDLRRRIQGCDDGNGRAPTVNIRGVGRVAVADLPLITARVPLDAEVSLGGAVFGSVGRTRNLELAVASCGTLQVANIADRLELAAAGSGDVEVGTSRRAEVALAGSGDVRLGPVGGPLEVSLAGSGDVLAVSVAGGLSANIVGSGDVVVQNGRTGPVDASIMGSGDVRVGAAQSVSASIMGSGDVRVGQVSGPVRRSVMGSGEVIVGR